MGPIPRPLAERLAARTRNGDGGCLLWTGSTAGEKMGYGRIYDHSTGSNKRTHRVAYEIANGSMPDGMHVLHKCDVPACVNPEHLFLGTNAENVADKVAKGRQQRGEKHSLTMRGKPAFIASRARGEKQHSAKLTESDVLSIRARLTGARGELTALAKEFDVNKHAIWAIAHRKTWTHI